jgi:DNA-binding XRE family transcriptional regulator/uncharacterized cupin superfamily protein
MEPQIPPIPERLKQLRGDLGLSLDELADKAGVSRAMLSKIERGAASPTIGLLCKVSTALGVSITRLVAEPSQRNCRLIERQSMPQIAFAEGITRTSLSTELPGWNFELVEYAMAPGETTAECGTSETKKQELLYVLEGAVDIVFCDERQRVEAGSSFVLETTECRFEIVNASDTTSRYLMVLDRRS